MKKILSLFTCLLLLVGCSNNTDTNTKSEVIVENEEPKSEYTNKYFYDQLTDKEKKYYDLLLEASENYSNKITGDFKFNNDDFVKALNAFVNDNPLYYWWREAINTSSSGNTFTSTADCDYKSIESNVNKVNEIANKIISECKVENNYQTIKNIHDYIVMNVSYDTNATNGHSVVGGLIDSVCVCDGYATTFKLLCNTAGFNCNTIEGQSFKDNLLEEHAWNFVELNNKWYLVDTTWDDPVAEDGQNHLTYDYFLISEDMMNIDHMPNNKFEYPTCDDESLFYFNMSGTYMKEYDKEIVSEFIGEWLKTGAKDIYIKFGTYEDGLKCTDDILQNGGFVDIYKEYVGGSYNFEYGGEYSISSYVVHIYYQ